MVRRQHISGRWRGVFFVVALVILLELGLAVATFWQRQFWSGMNHVLVVALLTYLEVFNVYTLERKARLLNYLEYGLAALGVASLVITWVIR